MVDTRDQELSRDAALLGDGLDVVRRINPGFLSKLEEGMAVVPDDVPPELIAAARALIASELSGGTADEARSPGMPPSISEWRAAEHLSATMRAGLALTEQYVFYVAGIDDDQVNALASEIGPGATYRFLQVLYLLDASERLRIVADYLFSCSEAKT